MTQFHAKSDYFRRLLLVLDVSLIIFAFTVVLQTYVALRADRQFEPLSHIWILILFVAVFWLSRKLLSKNVALGRPDVADETWGLIKEVLLSLFIVFGLIFLLKFEFVSRTILIGFAIFSFLLLVSMRWFLFWWYFGRKNADPENFVNVLIIGSGKRAHALGDRLSNRLEFGVNIVGFLDPKGQSAGRRASDEILGHVDRISEVLRDSVIDEVIVAVPRSMLGDVQEIIDACQDEGVRLRFMADIYDFDAARIRLTMVEEIPLLAFEPVARAENALVAKRMFDLVAVLLALPLLAPLMLIVAIAVAVDSRGPIFFTQSRVGLHKRKFEMYKFRSMVANAEELMAEVEHLNEADGPNFKIQNDPRITRVGRFIRKTSIDELPQLINVLKGEMSLVGPRPMSNRDVNLFDKGIQRKRFSVVPGITCLWQSSGRSDLSFDDWLRLDLKYIENWSFWLDIKILFKTIPVVLRGSGAA
jgi:exopolysaccharide biosynthesis polyprenyl glycosylphosphotransferase